MIKKNSYLYSVKNFLLYLMCDITNNDTFYKEKKTYISIIKNLLPTQMSHQFNFNKQKEKNIL